ncbi:hypothetical protein EYF80_033883 [Liparis tanakae]|uniref:Uncharacterized protein n=1 Tax=Liparis tanakae TaxID=230148 RepID=A0A4Z2GTF8_9TELE|nr:hypothetical protein EYF80_033883 [Liparis tanakae]
MNCRHPRRNRRLESPPVVYVKGTGLVSGALNDVERAAAAALSQHNLFPVPPLLRHAGLILCFLCSASIRLKGGKPPAANRTVQTHVELGSASRLHAHTLARLRRCVRRAQGCQVDPNQRTTNSTRGNASKVAQFRGKTADLATLGERFHRREDSRLGSWPSRSERFTTATSGSLPPIQNVLGIVSPASASLSGGVREGRQ